MQRLLLLLLLESRLGSVQGELALERCPGGIRARCLRREAARTQLRALPPAPRAGSHPRGLQPCVPPVAHGFVCIAPQPGAAHTRVAGAAAPLGWRGELAAVPEQRHRHRALSGCEE